jgi:hypothetical protein
VTPSSSIGGESSLVGTHRGAPTVWASSPQRGGVGAHGRGAARRWESYRLGH